MKMIGHLFFAFLFILSSQVSAQSRDLETQFQRSAALMIQNMIRQDAAPGAIVAAPSRQHPDYFYHWVRDAALVMEVSMDLYQSGKISSAQKQRLRQFFLDNLKFTQKNHESALGANGLGEPKFFVDGSVFNGPWGRPQNDGPALRASSLSRLLSIAISERWPQVEQIKKMLYEAQLPAQSLIKADLEYTAKRWRDANFDLWEEINGFHFYTLMTQREALAIGTEVAKAFNDPFAARFYQQEFHRTTQELQRFWDPNRQFIVATLGASTKTGKNSSPLMSPTKARNKSHLDAAVILAVLHSGFNEGVFSFADDRVVATYQKLNDTFHSIYPINQNKEFGTAFGRYPEDTYDGYQTNGIGNPWPLITAGAAEYLYKTTAQLARMSAIKITDTNHDFYVKTGGLSNLRVGQVITRNSIEHKKLLARLFSVGDRLLARVLLHCNPDGSLSEQINRKTGFMQGAPNLTWSHAAFLTAKMARDRAHTAVLTSGRGQ